jgi:hypothetical protein
LMQITELFSTMGSKPCTPIQQVGIWFEGKN